MEPKLVKNYPHVMVYETAPKKYFYQVGQGITSLDIYRKIIFLLQDDNLEELMYNGQQSPLKIYHKDYGLCDTNIYFKDADVYQYIQWVVTSNGKTISTENPLFDGTLQDGSRINITIPPASMSYPTFTIRKFKTKIISIIDLISSNVITPDAAAFLWCAVEGLGFHAANLIMAGGTGSGKTTTLNALLMFIPHDSRIVTIEDTPELKLTQSNIVKMVSNDEQDITMDSLLKNTLRMRPDRILVGEVRGEEAVTLFSAMNTGHQGCMGTLHANDARHCVTRITKPPMSVPSSLMSALDLIIIQERVASMAGHFRRIAEITEIAGSEDGNVRFNTIYKFDQSKNKLLSTDIPSKLRTKIADAAGIPIKEFDKILEKRAKLLEKLLKKKVSQEDLLTEIEQNRK